MTNYSLILARNFSVNIISHVKLQNCYGNGSFAQRQDGVEVNDEDVLYRTKAILEIFIEDEISNL